MDQTTILPETSNIYDMDTNIIDVNNKLFCTFVPEGGIDAFINDISSQYTILYNKVFVLEIKNSGEFVCTYNVDQPNINEIPQDTILVHRKKETNTLYTINALNELIKELNSRAGAYILLTRYSVNF